MPVLNLISETKGEINDVGYITSEENALFALSASKEFSFGNSYKDVLEVGIYNLQKELINYTVISGSTSVVKTLYTYSDIDGNTFPDYFNKSNKSGIQDPDKNILIQMSELVPTGSVTSNTLYLSVNPISNLFSYKNPLTIKEISNSRKEVKLVRSFKTEAVNDLTPVQSNVVSGITLNGKKEISLKSGMVHTLKFNGDVRKLKFSKVRGGTFNGAVEYTKGVVYKPESNEIILDATEGFPTILFVYNKDLPGSDCLINLTDKISIEDFTLNSEFLSLDKDTIILGDIYEEISTGLTSTHLSEVYNSTKDSFSSNITNLKNLLSFKGDDEVLSILSSILNGSFVFDYKLGKNLYLQGVSDFTENYLKFNYNFVGDFKSLRDYVYLIVDSTCLNRLSFYNPNVTKIVEKSIVKSSMDYLKTVIGSAVARVMLDVETEYRNKYKGTLKTALNFGNGIIHPILSSVLINKTEYWVKLKDPLADGFSTGNSCTVSNISIQPFFQLVTVGTSPSERVIKLSSPNFSVNLDEPSNRSNSTKYYSAGELSIDREYDNKISINKKLLDLNIDYSNFQNFIIFSSANLRIKIFENKVINITNLNSQIKELTLIDSGSSSVYDRLSVYDSLESAKSSVDDIINSFDGYESYLYKSGKFIYNTNLGTFVETSGSVIKSSYVSTLESDSVEYDRNNRDSLINNSPEYIYENSENDDYLKFLSMIGHHFDNIYLHVSNIGIYKPVGHDIDSGMTGEMVSYVLSSLGFKIPPGMSGLIESSGTIENYLSSNENTDLTNGISIDEKTKTIWKRMLINLPSIYKSKGTEECLRQIFSIYGIPNNLIVLKEFGGGYTNSDISSSYTTDESSYLLEFLGNKGECIEISSSVVTPCKSIDFKLFIDQTYYSSSRIIVPIHSRSDADGNQIYSFGFVKTSTFLGRFYFTIANSTDLFTSFTNPVYLFSDDPMDIMIRKNYIDPAFGDVQDPNIPTKYDILINRQSSGGKNVDEKTSFYLSGSLNSTFDTLGGTFSFGNTKDGLIEDEIGRIIESEDESFFFEMEGIDFGKFVSGYSIVNFKGCLDRITIQQTPLSDGTFYIRGKCIDSYYQGEPSSSYDDILFRFNLGIPVDFSSASLATGYVVKNSNPTYSSSCATLFNFIGNNMSSSLSPESCLTSSYSYFPHQTKEFNIVNEYPTQFIGPGRLENRKVNYSSTNTFNSRLSPTTVATYKDKSNQYSDTNKLGIFVSPIHERNKDILNFFGDYDIISAVSNPNDRFGRRYLKLEELRRNYYKDNIVKKTLFNELFTIYKIFINKSIFETLKSVLPARNRVYTGILVEATLLERSRIDQKPVDITTLTSLNSEIDLKSMPITSTLVSMFTSSLDVSYISRDNASQVNNSFSGLSAFTDRGSEYETNIFIGENGFVEYGGSVFRPYVRRFKRTKGFDDGSSDSKYMFTVELVPTESSLVPSAEYSPVDSLSQFRPLVNKHLPLRKVHSKSVQTSNTTINDSNTADRSPIISTSVGPNINTGNFGVKT